MATIFDFPDLAQTLEDEIDRILDEVPAPPPGLVATRDQRRARYARLAREGKARHARETFRVIA